jgi:4-diphosphocytidyl-2-C-methyl-D-erythritol kinase
LLKTFENYFYQVKRRFLFLIKHKKMICFPNAKINIGLNITGRKPDGFHIIETILFPVELCDVLEFVEDNKIKGEYNLNTTGIKLNVSAEDNICIQALKLIKKDYDIPSLSVRLHKIIPAGAGLGGGSSDAAHMLKSLNKEFHLNISGKKLQKYAGQLGSDCPFFITNSPSFAYDTGNKLRELDITLYGYYVVIVYPNIHIGTGLAYSQAFIKRPKYSLEESVRLPVEEWKNVIKNDFESTIFPKYPVLSNIKRQLYNMGALFASLSGSGSALYGIFDSVPEISSQLDDYLVWQFKI